MRYGLPWQPSPNFSAGPTEKVRVVLHRMAGAYAGGVSWLCNPASQVSAHFCVDDVSGAAVQLVDTSDIAWAEAAFNPTSISIEIGGEVTDPVSDAAWQTIVRIVSEASRFDSVPLKLAVVATDPGLSYHALLGVPGGNHPDCPGAIVYTKRQWIIDQITAPQPPETLDMDDMTYTRWCYYEFFLRDPDPAGFASWVGFLNGGGSRNDMMATFIDTAEGQTVLTAKRKSLALSP